MGDKEHNQLKNEFTNAAEGDDARAEILNMIESGQIDVEEGLKRLQDSESEESNSGVLNQLEAGEIDVNEAIRFIESESVPAKDSAAEPEFGRDSRAGPSTEKFRSWWLLIPAIGFSITAFGGWLSTIGGWWWLCAAPSLLAGVFVLLFALATQNAPWLHIRIDTGQATWPRRIALSFPVPIRLASWGLRKWGHYGGSLDATAVDELLLSLESTLSAENPIHIEVNEDDESGERIQVYLG